MVCKWSREQTVEMDGKVQVEESDATAKGNPLRGELAVRIEALGAPLEGCAAAGNPTTSAKRGSAGGSSPRRVEHWPQPVPIAPGLILVQAGIAGGYRQ